MRNALLTLLLFGLLAASADPAAFYAGMVAARVRGSAVTDAWAAAGLNTGLIEYWAMRTNGTAVIAEYGTNTATAVNGVLFGSAYGKRDGGSAYNATSNYIDCGAVGVIDEPAAATFAAWINLTAKTAVDGTIIHKFDDGMVRGIFLARDAVAGATGRTNTFTIVAAEGAGKLAALYGASNIANTGTWIHVCGVYQKTNAAGLRLYINGVEDPNSPVSTATIGTVAAATRTVQIGYRSPFETALGVAPFGGSIDEVAVWNRALSSNEVFNLYNTPLYAPYKP
jgi:hypothetical protein